jgi:hypothetical protein
MGEMIKGVLIALGVFFVLSYLHIPWWFNVILCVYLFVSSRNEAKDRKTSRLWLVALVVLVVLTRL